MLPAALVASEQCTIYVAWRGKQVGDGVRRREIARELQVSILSYDYSGYGCSTGALSVANTLADIDAAYEWLLAHGRKPSDVILYGAPGRYSRRACLAKGCMPML